jgi:hypothetical protein
VDAEIAQCLAMVRRQQDDEIVAAICGACGSDEFTEPAVRIQDLARVTVSISARAP